MAKQFSFVEPVALKHARLSIKPYVGQSINTGLKEYNMVVHDNIKHTDCVICISDGRTKTYKTGLNENTAEVQTLHGDEKIAKIKSIRQLVARAEREIAGNFNVDPDEDGIENNKEFWKNVTMFKSVIPDVFDNKGVRQLTYWDEFVIVMSNEGIILNENNVKHLLMISVIEAGGFSLIADSFETARADSRGIYKFYLDKRQDTSDVKIVDKKIRDKAGAKLFAISENDSNKLFYITKLISVDSMFFKTGKNATPTSVFYEECSNFIEGLTPKQRVQTLACQEFISYADMTIDKLKARVALQDGMALNYIMLKENELWHVQTSTILGKNYEDAIAYLTNPANVKLHDTLIKQCTAEWAK